MTVDFQKTKEHNKTKKYEVRMKKYINKLNSVLMLWISGLFLLASFITEYILPLLNIPFEFLINPAWVSLFISGIPLVYFAVTNTLKRKITSPLLITIAMVAAVYIGDVFAAGEVAFIMAIGEWLEDKTVEKAKKGIEKLLNLVPTQGRVITEDGEKMVEAKDIKPGDVIRVFPGESFPADGVIVVGYTTVDQSILTGESLPVDKSEGEGVFAGTINRYGSVDIKVAKAFEDSSLQKMIKLVEDAEDKKAPTQKTVDRWAGYLVPSACLIAIITYIVFAFVLSLPDVALTRAVTILVVFCPCALALATPTSIMAAIGQATKNGVLIKSGEALEQMGNVSAIAFDKTGTITVGKPQVSDVITYDIDKHQLLSLSASVESRSEHPIGKAVVKHATENDCPLSNIEGFLMALGKGVSAKVGQDTIFCGNEKLIEDNAKLSISEDANKTIWALRQEGKAVVIVSDSSKILGVIGLSDTVKEGVAESLKQLKKVGVDDVILLTGDNEKTANFVASNIGISNVMSSLLPEQKVQAITDLFSKHEKVCMVGDGVNDAAALKISSVGIAMGTMGSDIAIDAADIAILGDDISKISYIKKLSNATIFSIKFNITLAMIINFVAIILSVMGLLTPATGALVHNAGSVLVVLNAARLYDKKL